MNDIEQEILHNANNIFFIRVVALDWTEGFGQYSVDRPLHIEQFLHYESGPWSLAWPKASSVLTSDGW